MTRIKKILLNPWTISIGSPFIVTGITALVKQINFFEALKLLLSWMLKVVTFKIPLYVIILAIVFFTLVITVYAKIQDAKENNRPDWLSYTKDYYKDWVLKWEYYLGYYNNKYEIQNLRPICQCGCELSMKYKHNHTYYNGGVLVCPNCEATYKAIDKEILEDFHKKLVHNINIGNYPKDLEHEVSENV